ncbi:MAG: PqiC family protein [Caldimonas sp.]
MSRFRPLSATAFAALVVLGACSTSAPPTRLHSLMPSEPTPREPGAAGRVPVFVSLEPIRLPAQVDQPQWLVRLPDDSLASLEQERWASSLRDELRQALLEQLGARFGVVDGRSVIPQAAAPVRVALELRRFDSIPGREARIEAAWTVVGGAAAAIRCSVLLSEPAQGGMAELAAAHRRAVARLAVAIGASLVAVPPASLPGCPPGEQK